MVKLFCDKCREELTDIEYCSIGIRSSLIAKHKDPPDQELGYELCVPCHEFVMSALDAAISEQK